MEYEVILFSDSSGRGWYSKTLAPYRLATELRQNGFSVKVIDYFSQWLSDISLFTQLIDKYVSEKTLIVGFCSTFFRIPQKKFKFTETYTYEQYFNDKVGLAVWPTKNIKEFLQIVRDKNSNTKLVYGGFFNDSKLDGIASLVDFAVKGYGDKPIVELASHIKFKTPIKYSRSLRKESNSIRTKIIDYDVKGFTFNFPDSKTIFTDDDDVQEGEVLPLELSRGCLFKCSFCSFPLLGRKKGDPEYLKRNNRIVEELTSNYEQFKTTKYMIVDDTFNETTFKIENVLKVRDELKIDLEFSAYLRLDLLARFPEQIKLLKELGIRSAFLGIESLNWESAKAIGKGIHPEKVKEALYELKAQWGSNTSIHGSFIIGLPFDNEKNCDEWVPWVIADDSPFNGFDFNTLSIGGTSELAMDPAKYGYEMAKPNEKIRWRNKHWTDYNAHMYTKKTMNTVWNSGRLKISGWDVMGMQNMGYAYDELYNLSYKDINRLEVQNKVDLAWLLYKQKILS